MSANFPINFAPLHLPAHFGPGAQQGQIGSKVVHDTSRTRSRQPAVQSVRYRGSGKIGSRFEVRLTIESDGCDIQVSDNGLGLAADERECLFELLYRAAPVRPSGPGVGLAVVKRLVEQSGGRLKVASGSGLGTTFTVTLPPDDLDDHR
jgi:signal transduction histidine kinase